MQSRTGRNKQREFPPPPCCPKFMFGGVALGDIFSPTCLHVHSATHNDVQRPLTSLIVRQAIIRLVNGLWPALSLSAPISITYF